MADLKKFNIKAVVFDLDNTLYNYKNSHEKALFKALNMISVRHQISFDTLFEKYEEIRINLKKTLKNTASSHSRYIYFFNIYREFKYNLNEVEEIHSLYWHTYLKSLKLNPGVKHLLEILKKRKIKTYILSDFLIEYTFKKLIALKILHYFEDIITSEEVGEEKPSANCYLTLIKRVNYNAINILMVGDDLEKDIQGALDQKINVAHYKNLDQSRKKDDFFSFSSFQDLEQFILRSI
jgi:putative hydrolase of the HAD superfamily